MDDSGNVSCVFPNGAKFRAHAAVLSQHSPVMRELLSDEYAVRLSKKAIKAGVVTQFRLRLIPADGDLQYVLARATLNDQGVEQRDGSIPVLMENENGRTVNPHYKAWESVLRALNGEPITLGDAQEDNMTDLLRGVLDALAVAEYLDCVRIITSQIEATLLATGQNLWRAIGENPVGWLSLADRLRSKAIFKEALIHTVGTYNADQVRHDTGLSDAVLDVLDRKAQEVINGVSHTCLRLTSFYPAALTREKSVGRVDSSNAGRADYGNDILGWIALSAFRQFIGTQMALDNIMHAKDMGFAFIQAISKGGDAYLPRTQMQREFHARFPMSHKGMAAVEHRLTEIKNNVKPFTARFMQSECQLDIGRYPVPHFTHITVAPEDYPWVAEEAAAREEALRAEIYGPREDLIESESESSDEDAGGEDEEMAE